MRTLVEDGSMTEQPLVSGGGWEREPESTPIYPALFLVLGCAAGVFALLDGGALRWPAGIAGVLLMVLAIVGWRSDFPDPPGAGEDDPHSLYAARGGEDGGGDMLSSELEGST